MLAKKSEKFFLLIFLLSAEATESDKFFFCKYSKSIIYLPKISIAMPTVSSLSQWMHSPTFDYRLL